MPDRLEINRHWHDLPLPLHDAYNFEINRLRSFHKWHKQDTRVLCPVSALKLAKEGFHATGRGDEVKCYSCGKRHSRWRSGDDIKQKHREISPTCPLVSQENYGRARTPSLPNIPIPSRAPVPMFPNLLHQFWMRLTAKVSIEESGCEPDNPVRPTATQLLGVHVRNGRGRRSPGALLIPRERDGSLPYTARLESELPSGPLFPQFSSAVERDCTLRGFPITRGHLTAELSRHGFFFVGHGDIVLCHCCGLGLNNWAEHDDPALAHSRWNPECNHLQSVVAPNFIELTRREAEVIGFDN